MTQYRCLRCGTTAEYEEHKFCPSCGFIMAPVSRSRKQALIQEIRKRIIIPERLKVSAEQLTFYRNIKPNRKADGEKIVTLAEDQKRFPDFSEIYKYIRAAKKTEIFFERIDNTLEQIRKHIHQPFSEKYQTNYENLIQKIDIIDQSVQKTCSQLNIEPNFPDFSFQESTLDYSETPDPALLLKADTLLDDLEKLRYKISAFIKKNNIYGAKYQNMVFKPSSDSVKDLTDAIKRVENTLQQNITVDIFSDGSDELNKMLTPFWSSLSHLCGVPILKHKMLFHVGTGKVFTENEFFTQIEEVIKQHFNEINAIISDDRFLSDKTEEWLLNYCEKMIEDEYSGQNGVSGAGKSEQRLNDLIGLQAVKQSIRKIKAYALANIDSDTLNLHMCFLGNPGTGKTEAARIIAGILYENGILPTSNVVEVDRGGLVGQYVGETPQKTLRKIHEAMGGVLFIDEAYALIPKDGHFDYGHEAVATLIKAMEDYRGKFCVILAGYRNEMQEMLSSNPGFRSRIQFTLDFENYNRDELKLITEKMLSDREYTISEQAMEKILDITDVRRKDPAFANAREIRNILDQVIMCQNVRCEGAGDKVLEIADVNHYIKDAGIRLPVDGQSAVKRILTGEEELDQLVGLESVKRMVRKIKAYAKRNVGSEGFNLHMVFYGNPGTGKTEVARIISRILYDAGVLGGAKLIETDGLGLLGSAVGETAPKVMAKINEAMNGVLFIDEAYAMSSGSNGAVNYGDEAIAVLLKEMEDRRGQFCVILAGYKKEMEKLLSANPGFESRIQFALEFPDYTRDELREIAEKFLAKKKYEIETDAMDLVLDIMDYYRREPNFANVRTLRNLLDQVIMNQNLRAEDTPDDITIIRSDVEDYLSDEKIDLNKQNRGSRHMGFV